jgi:hypothetical protein
VIHLGQVLAVDPEPGEVVLEELVEQPVVVLVEQGVLEDLEGVELAPFVDQVEAINLLNSAVVLEEGGPRVGRAQSNCTGILEACPPPQ